jgi:hypothetical protein
MECFRIDESGYTGFDLLNPDQRFQGASAIAITDEDAARLINEHFPRLQASELKYRSIESSFSLRSNSYLRRHGLPPWGSDADVQSAAIGELVRPVCGLGFANLDIGQHRRPPKYPA